MGLNIKNDETYRLVEELSRLTGESSDGRHNRGGSRADRADPYTNVAPALLIACWPSAKIVRLG